ncbi:MAG: MotE family protein [Parvularculaceae bacterium]
MKNAAARARILPAAIAALTLLAGLKAAHLWIGFSSADAAPPAASAPGKSVISPSREDEDGFYEPAAPAPSQSEVERRILQQLAERRAALDAREEEIDTRERLLEAAEQRLEARMQEYESRRSELEALETAREQRNTEELEALVNAYERMKSKDAARIFEALDEDILVSVAAEMRTQALAGVLADMTPEKARRLTKLLAERKDAQAGGG